MAPRDLSDEILRSAELRDRVDYDRPLRFAQTVGAVRLSNIDPSSAAFGSTAVAKALHTPTGPATVVLGDAGPGRVELWGWGPGAEAGLAQARCWLGLDDPLESFDPSPHPVVERLARRRGPVRMGRFGCVAERLVPAVLGQLVIGKEAKRSYRRLVSRYGTPAPGPWGLTLTPDPSTLEALGSHHFHQLGVERKRATVVKRVAREADRLDALVHLPLPDAYARLLAVPGIGPWTAATVARTALGDPDAVLLGDYNMPHLVGWALAGKRRSTDEEMLELLAPFAGHRARVQMLLKGAGGAAKPPRRSPRLPFREIERH